MERPTPSGTLVEAEEFDNYGGWILDSQFETQMGSPYLLAHGYGTPVADATTTISIPTSGSYNVWVRAKDWVPRHHPGRFKVSINGEALDTVFGANDQDWNWQLGGKVALRNKTTLALHDLTGFCGRCDAIFLTQDQSPPPNAVNAESRAWRQRLRGLPGQISDGGSFDVVVVGGGVPGVAAALTAARLGDRVALVQDRPVLGGNASVEIGLSPRGVRGPLVEEISARTSTGDLEAMKLLAAETKATVLLSHNVFNAVTRGSQIVAVDARDARTGRETRLSAPIFIDCSGKAILGLYSGAETLFGQESRAEFGESLAPPNRSEMHHGNTVFFRTQIAKSPVAFPAVPWATEVAQDYSDLGGQLRTPGIENAPGPAVVSPEHVPDPTVARRMLRPMTHFWEYGQWLDPYTQAEEIRDHLLRAIFGTFSNVKTLDPVAFANLEFDWVAFVAAQGEFRRYKGDYVVTETDIRTHKSFPDAVVQNGGAFCLHYPGHNKYDFRLKHWDWDERDGKPYDIPFRCLYSTNISNLMMAGKHISVTHVAGSNTKFMGNGAQHAIATAVAAHLCKRYHTTPLGVYEQHLPELRTLAREVATSDAYRSKSNAKSKL